MFDPDPATVRRFLSGAWRKRREALPQTPLEVIAADWIERHPEYHGLLADEEKAVAFEYSVDNGQENPFLHLSLHLSVHEQISIDQPRGIRAAWQALVARTGSEHEAAHRLVDCLAETVWQAQRTGRPIDEAGYRRAIAAAAGLAPPDVDADAAITPGTGLPPGHRYPGADGPLAGTAAAPRVDANAAADPRPDYRPNDRLTYRHR